MAELLVVRQAFTNPDPEKNKGTYKVGDVVTVKPDRWRWGRKERGSRKFVIISVSGPVSDYEDMIEMDVRNRGTVNEVIENRRRRFVDRSLMDANERSKFDQNESMVVGKARFAMLKIDRNPLGSG